MVFVAPSWRFRVCEITTEPLVEHGDFHRHDRQVSWVNDAMRVEETLTRLPPGVRQTMLRRSRSRKSSARTRFRYRYRQQHRLVNTYSLIVLLSGTLTMVWPTRAAEGLFGVPDRPRLVEAVDERSVECRSSALLDIPTHAQIAVADREKRLNTKIICDVLRFGELPFMDRETVTVEWVGRRSDRPDYGAHDSASSARSATTMSAPDSVSRCARRHGRPTTRPKPPACTCLHPGDCVLEHAGALDGHTEFLSSGDEGVRAGLTFQPFSAATLPSTMTSNRRRRSAASSTADALRDDVTHSAILVLALLKMIK